MCEPLPCVTHIFGGGGAHTDVRVSTIKLTPEKKTDSPAAPAGTRTRDPAFEPRDRRSNYH